MKVKRIDEKVDWKVTMEGNNSNIDRLRNVATQVNIDPVMGEVVRETEVADKMVGDTFKELAKNAEGITPKDPDTGKKITMKPYTEKLSLDESLFGESWTSFGGSWRDQTVKKVNYEEEDISDIAYELMNWYGECFEGWEAADIKDALYGLEGERIPGSSCPIVFTMEESEDDEFDWDDEEYDESLNTELKEDDYDRPGYENMYLVSWEDSIGDYHESKVKADYPQHAIDKIKKSKHIYRVINVEKINMFTAPKRIRKAELIEKKKEKSKHLCEDYEGTEYSDMLFDMLDQDLVDSKKVAKDLVYMCNELDIQDYMKKNNYKIDFEVEESLIESVVANARHWLIDKENKSPEEATEIIKNSSPEELEKIALKWTKKESLEESEEKKSLVEDINESWKDESWKEDGEKHTLLKYYIDSKDKFHGAIMKDPTSSEFGSIVGYIYEGDKIVKKDESFNSIDDAKKWVEKEVQDLSDKKDESLKEDWRLDPGTTLRSKSGNEITIKDVVPYVSEYDGSVNLKISYSYVLTDGRFGSSVCDSIDLFNMLNESVNEELTEEVDEDDEETVFDFVDERLFGDPSRRNASNYRLTNSFCKDVWVPLVGGKGRFRNVYFYPSGIEHLAGDDADENRRAPMTDSGIAINLKSEDEASLAKAVADELNFKFSLTPINNSKYKFLAKIIIPESIYEMPIEDYLESIGKSIKDYRKRSKRKSKEN